MKENEAPERIYIFDNPILDFTKLSVRQSSDDIEYVRADAFIEAVADWISDNLQTVSEVTPSAHHVESIPALGIITQTEFIEKFKKEIMFLFD